MDRVWWKEYGREAAEKFSGDRFTTAADCLKHGARRITLQTPGNSGAALMQMAGMFGAAKLVLLGYDCQLTAGEVHWHGRHPAGLGNAGSLPKWPEQFRKTRDRLRGIEIINCSRETSLRLFRRAALEDVL